MSQRRPILETVATVLLKAAAVVASCLPACEVLLGEDGNVHMKPPPLTVLLTMSVMVGCADHTPRNESEFTPVQDWVTEPHYEFGDAMEGDAVFGSVSDVNVHSSPEGLRVFVLDGRSSEVTIWTAEGALIRRVGRDGPGPGEFEGPDDLVVLEDRFHVADQRRFTTFALDGEFLRTDLVPLSMSWRGFRLRHEALFADGSMVATPIVPVRIMAGSMGDDPVDVLPAVRVFREGSSWASDTLALVSYRNPIGDDEVQAVVRQKAGIFASWGGDSIPSQSLRRRVRDALVVPEAWPVTRGIRVMSNGEIWFRAAKSDVPDRHSCVGGTA